MRITKLISLTIAMLMCVPIAAARADAPATTLTGAGSTLVAPLVAEWATEFQVFDGVTINYSASGSQSGLADISSGSVDFGAIDSPLTSAEDGSCPRCLQIPWTLTGLGIGYHVSGIGDQLRLSGPVLAEVYMGQIKRWNDPRIAKLNPKLKLPALKITPIYANDSGDTVTFTTFLSRVDTTWRKQYGIGSTVTFPTGVNGSSNADVTSLLASTNGSITYVGTAYLITHALPAAAIENAAGRYEFPNLANVSSAGASIKSVPAGNALQIVDPAKSAPNAYPLSTFIFAVISPNDPASHRTALKNWISYATGGGQVFGRALDFAPLPSIVAKADKATVKTL